MAKKKLSEEHKKKISERMKRSFEDPESRKQHSQILKKSHARPEVRQKISEATKKALSNPEVRKKMDERHKHHPENCQCIGCVARRGEVPKGKDHHLYGKPQSEKQKRKISESRKKQWQDPEYRKRNIQAVIKALSDPEVRKKMGWKKGKPFSEEHIRNLRKIWQSPEHRAKLSKALKGLFKDDKHPRWKGGSKNYWRKISREIWELVHGEPVPKGMLIHHIDGNVENIDPENLQLRTYSSHFRWHKTVKKLIDEVAEIVGQTYEK